MKLNKLVLTFLFLITLVYTPYARAQELNPPPDEYTRGQVLTVRETSNTESAGITQISQEIEILLTSGPDKGQTIKTEQGDTFALQPAQRVNVGEQVVLVKTEGPTGRAYFISDKYRLPQMGIVFALFIFLAVLFAGIRGLTSVAGLGVSIVVLVSFIVPQIMSGADPVVISLIGSVIIAFIALYVAHGINIRTTISLVATLITLFISVFLSSVFVSLTKLSGSGSEDAIFLQTGTLAHVNLQGLLLGGIIIGALGVLDDITTSQTAAVEELKKVHPKITFSELMSSGISIGREHIASLINTLVLAYAGASLPLLLLFTTGNTPIWVTLNSEFLAEEIIRTLVGSTALILAVPISTVLATYIFTKYKIPGKSGRHIHAH